MEAELEKKLGTGNCKELLNWIKKQPTRQLYKALLSSQITYQERTLPRLFALIHSLQIPDERSAETFREITEFYLSAGCDINEVCNLPPSCRSRRGFSPLLLAIDNRKLYAAKMLIELGADVKQEQKDKEEEGGGSGCRGAGYSALHWAAFTTTSSDLVKWLLEAGAEIGKPGKKYKEGVHPVLHVAVDEGRVEIVSFLLSQGVDINTTSKYKVLKEQYWGQMRSRYDCGSLTKNLHTIEISALGRAVRMRKLDVLNVLFKSKAKVSFADLNYCILEGDSTTANMLLHFLNKAELANIRVQGTETFILHGLGKRAFLSGESAETEQLVKTFVENGFDLNSLRYCSISGYLVSLLDNAVQFHRDNQVLINGLLEMSARPSDFIIQLVLEKGFLCVIKLFLNHQVEILSQTEIFHNFIRSIVREEKWVHLETFKMCISNSELDLNTLSEYFEQALEGTNELVVNHILQKLPEEDTIDKEWLNLMAERTPSFIKRILGGESNFEPIDLTAVHKIFEGFINRGWKLSDSASKALPNLILDVAMPHFQKPGLVVSHEEPEKIRLMNYIIKLDNLKWHWESEPIKLAVSYCFDPYRTIIDEGKFGYGKEWKCVDIARQEILILNNILDIKGVSAHEVDINQILSTNSCWLADLQTIKKLWWAGARVNFNLLETFIISTNFDDQDQNLVRGYEQWIRWGKRSDSSLQRITAIKIRRLMTSHDYDRLSGNTTLPLWKIKQLIFTPQYVSNVKDDDVKDCFSKLLI